MRKMVGGEKDEHAIFFSKFIFLTVFLTPSLFTLEIILGMNEFHISLEQTELNRETECAQSLKLFV